MTTILSASPVEDAVAGRPGWHTPKPHLAVRVVFLQGQRFTDDYFVAFEAGVSQRPGEPTAAVIITRLSTRGGWSQLQKRVTTRELRDDLAGALRLADELLAAAVEHDKGRAA